LTFDIFRQQTGVRPHFADVKRQGLAPFLAPFFFLVMVLPAQNLVEMPGDDLEGQKIARAADRKNSSWYSEKSIITLLLRDKKGSESKREMEILSLEKSRGNQSLLRFTAPARLRDLSLLTHEIKGKDDLQWLYLPSSGHVRRIVGAGKSGAFAGSEFTYEDLGGRDYRKYDWSYLKQDVYEGKRASIIRFIPLHSSAYSMGIEWIETNMGVALKIDFYDKGRRLRKTATFDDYELYGKQWRASSITMKNHVNGRSSVMLVKKRVFPNPPLSESLFYIENLKD